jgi:hypothetical protein
MSRPLLITDTVKTHIVDFLLVNSKTSVEGIHEDLRKYLRKTLKNEYPDLTVEEVNQEVETGEQQYLRKNGNGYRLPGESAITKWLEKDQVREKIEAHLGEPAELDREWNIGACACVKYGLPIPSEMVPLLLEINEKEKEPTMVEIPNFVPRHEEPGTPLTLRLARWIAYLYPIAKKSKPILEYVKGDCEPGTEIIDSPQFKGIVGMLAEMYAKREQIAEIMHQPFVDTSDLDLAFSTNGEFDLIKLWFKTFEPEEYKKDTEAMKTFEPLRRDILTSLLGISAITQGQVDIFNQWLKNQLLSQIEPHQVQLFDQKLREKYPEIQPIIDSWFKWIEKHEKAGK